MHELRSAAESGGKPGNANGFLINIDANRCCVLSWLRAWHTMMMMMMMMICSTLHRVSGSHLHSSLRLSNQYSVIINSCYCSGGPKIGLPRRGWDRCMRVCKFGSSCWLQHCFSH